MLGYSIYSNLPHSLKNFSASLYGHYLSYWRYGSATDKLIEEFTNRESWSEERWKNYRMEELDKILSTASKQVPYYRNYWEQERKKGNRSSVSYLENWPILEKSIVRDNPKIFVNENSWKHPLYADHTSGTTGKPTIIYLGRTSVIKWYALMESRTRRWFGLDRKDDWGMFGGQKIIPLKQKRPPYWIDNHGLNQIYFSIYHINEDTAPQYLKKIVDSKIKYLMVYPSVFSNFSKLLKDLKIETPNLGPIFCNAEKITTFNRNIVHDVFKTKLIETYGMAEVLSGASECEHGTMHEWPEVGIAEILDHNSLEIIHEPGQMGDLLFTGLLNSDMPLIRYRNNDLGEFVKNTQVCPCKRTLPPLFKVLGRSKDLLTTPDGRKLYIVDSLFNDYPLIEGQLIQKSLDTFWINIVPEDGFIEKDFIGLKKKLKEYVGECVVRINLMEKIDRQANGKFSPFISEVTDG